MAASMKRIKTRIKSVESTRQITKAMELVATSKLRRAKERVERARPYHEVLADAIAGLQTGVSEYPTVFTEARPVKKTCYVVIGGDRGLAGGYNANLFRMVASLTQGTDYCVLPVGRKTLEHFSRTGCELVSSYFGQTAAIGVGDCKQIAELLCSRFSEGSFDRVVIVYTKFKSMLSQVPVSEALLPLELHPQEEKHYSNAILEGDAQTLIESIVPQYVAGILFSTLCESSASEHGARRTAMNAANKNAGEIIDSLVLHYNRARQAAITQEITEIVSGAEAL